MTCLHPWSLFKSFALWLRSAFSPSLAPSPYWLNCFCLVHWHRNSVRGPQPQEASEDFILFMFWNARLLEGYLYPPCQIYLDHPEDPLSPEAPRFSGCAPSSVFQSLVGAWACLGNPAPALARFIFGPSTSRSACQLLRGECHPARPHSQLTRCAKQTSKSGQGRGGLLRLVLPERL